METQAKKKAGRPRVERLKIRTNISIDKDVKAKGQNVAKKRGVTFSSLIETLIETLSE